MTTTQVTLSDKAESYIKSQIPKLKNEGVICDATGKPYTIRELASKLIDDAIQTAEALPVHEDSGEIVQFNNWLDLRKSTVQEIRQKIYDQVMNGNIDPIEMIIAINSFAKVFIGAGRDKGVKSLIMDSAVSELQQQYGSGKHMIKNFEVEQSETGVKYDYSHDPVWNDLNEAKAKADKALKDREERLKVARQPDILKQEEYETEVHGPTGEVFTVERPHKTSTTIIKCTLKN